MPAGGQGAASPEPAPREARDAMAFGQETGRALSDGRIVGRAEPFTKVFPSSRAVKRAVGAMAWAVLEDIALDARIDDAGRLVAETNVRRIADNLAANKDTVAKHLGRLRDYGFVLQEEGSRQDPSGRWEPCRYVLDPSACVERFTTTPSSSPPAADVPTQPAKAAGEPAGDAPPEPTESVGDGPVEPAGPAPARNGEHSSSGGSRAETPASSPCPKSSDTESAAVSEITGQGELGHPVRHVDGGEHAARAAAGAREPAAEASGSEPAACDAAAGGGVSGDADADATCEELSARLIAAGVAGHVAGDLAGRHERHRIEQVLAVAAAQPPRNTAGWIVRALRDGWDLSDRLAEIDQAETQARQAQAHQVQAQRVARDRAEQAQADDADRQRAEGWSQAISAALDDDQLAAAVALVTTPVAPLGRRSAPVARSQLVTWAALVTDRFADRSLPEALAGALEQGLDLGDEVAAGPPLPDPPPVEQPPAAELRQRLDALLKGESFREPVSKGA